MNMEIEKTEKNRLFIDFIQAIREDIGKADPLDSMFSRFLGVIGASTIFSVYCSNPKKIYSIGSASGNAAESVVSFFNTEDRESIEKLYVDFEDGKILYRDEFSDIQFFSDLAGVVDFSSVMIAPLGNGNGNDNECLVCAIGNPDESPFTDEDLEMFKAFSRLVSIEKNRSLLKDKLDSQNRQLASKDFDLYTVYQVSKSLSSILDVEELSALISDMLTEVLTVDRAVIFVMDEETSELKAYGYKNLNKEKFNPWITLQTTEKLMDWLLPQMSDIKVIDDFTDELLLQSFPEVDLMMDKLGVKLLVPLVHKYKLVGFFALGSKYVGTGFQKRDYDFLSTIAPLAANAISNAHLYELAILDGLTKVYLARYFRQRCKEEIKRATRYKQVLSLIMWDIDHFKNVNDVYGHLMGDVVLKEMTTLFRKSFRTGVDLIGRYGGEEFVMLLPDTPRDGALIMAERLRQKVEAHEFGGGKVRMTISGGIATFPEDGVTYNRLIEQADIYLYKAKRTGRNKVCTIEDSEDQFMTM
ncbi:MAG: sensor domain-containing diguanylate cyclase [Firmicutes bacterium]|nr:sensor domain-containing diguanylate cyclase [Bacillota bacterium]